MKPSTIRRLRTRERLTLDQFAARLGVNRMTVWRWEQGRSAPTEPHARALRELARAPKVTP